MIEMNLVN